MKNKLWIASLVLGLALQACDGSSSGPAASESEPSVKAPVGSIQIESSVPQDQRDGLAKTLAYLDANPIPFPTSEMLEVMGINDATIATLQSWLEARVHYVIPQNFDFESRAFIEGHYDYQDPQEIPIMAKPTRTIKPGDKVQVVMSNIAGGYYVVGKSHEALIGLKLEGIGTVAITSPRIGVLEIGTGMFSQLSQSSERVKDIFRLATLFHEARHSDGHGLHAGFLHPICPSGSDYAGLAACDDSVNGPYTVGALIEKNLLDSCSECTAGESERLKLLYLDNRSRLIDNQKWDPSPEGTF